MALISFYSLYDEFTVSHFFSPVHCDAYNETLNRLSLLLLLLFRSILSISFLGVALRQLTETAAYRN